MARYVAFLRGVSPLNAKMSELKNCFEAEGFTNVVTVLSSGNVVFDTSKKAIKSLERQIEVALEKKLGRSFSTIVRLQVNLREMLDSNPFKDVKSPSKSKHVVTFLKDSTAPKPKLPIRKDGVVIFKIEDQVVYSLYVPHPKGPAFMVLLEKQFGKLITTRTWETIKKVTKK
ncbi:DUF1697 domain-containing protein [Bdellovibrio sp. NC01]|uniref:DUF1697 domain-containing protein n=1 Tax=Bdellovibrio sp. NC01 TaxID=2220073 RepID=UPI001158C0C1|nr:DUF1697 domain-containing protein [Bdellovibrio sp. NC01]QDK37969.1 hypothetical protein DOE51_10400 [Bdellovibrio sp. NC01]